MRIDFSQPCVMAILNATPDSFFAGSRTVDETAIERRVRECLDQGADLIDVGGYSSRPGADAVVPDEEWRRVSTALGVVRRLAPHMPVSVDTFRASVAAQAAERFGEVIINDISAGELDPAMPATVARLGVPYIIMHMKGDPQTMQTLTDYRSDIVTEVCGYFGRRVAELTAAGIRRGNIVLDPGFGFAKTLEQNYELLAGLHKLCALGFPVLAGLSRKSMIYRALDASPADALAGTVALGWEALRQGATVLRVHDVREAADTVRLFGLYEQNRKQA
ncbi:dihydropteroate synthase [Alistipes muris]|uniref:dihydropteroate synthase n=2 Tax=Alistipes TaxID=239759 RepID=UPI003B846E2E